eukprot:TRINITY_DN61692_c0_g1_i1.p1 TRINITY_DN61692_c0_g1~~TRINITY_DN61692_c0_g1_i1.p1  ORF type:complete len:237 (+),score=65.10 TRINITY_DN61692_c0_g1_i1:126-836(+)
MCKDAAMQYPALVSPTGLFAKNTRSSRAGSAASSTNSSPSSKVARDGRRHSAASSSASRSSGSRRSRPAALPPLKTQPAAVAGRLKAYFEGSSADDTFFGGNASYSNPVVRVVYEPKVILCVMHFLFWICSSSREYKVCSCFSGRENSVVIEAKFTFRLRAFCAWVYGGEKCSWYLFHTVHLTEETDNAGDTQWSCTHLEEVWDSGMLLSTVPIFLTPVAWVAGACLGVCRKALGL